METYQQSFKIEKRPRPWLRWPKRIGKGLLVMAIILAARQYWRHYQTTKKLDETLAEMDRAEPGWRLEEIEAARDSIPEEENSARVVVAVSKLLPKNWPSTEFADLFTHLAPEERLAPDDFVRLKQELDNVRPALEEAHKLAGLPRGRHRIAYRTPPIETLLDDQQQCRRVIALLRCDALRHIQDGDARAAVRACRAAFNTARSLGDEPLSISQLIRNACIFLACRDLERILAQGEPPLEELAAMQHLLRDEEAFPDLLIVARGERAAVHETFLELENGQPQSDPRSAKSNWWDNLGDWREREQLREGHPIVLALLSRFVAIAQLPEPERTRAERQLRAEILELDRRKVLPVLMLMSPERVNDSCHHKHACLRCLTVALAAERYRRANKGWPPSLDNLCPQFLADVPLDPFDGEPLRYRRIEDGVVIYSIGRDGVDNGGSLDPAHANQPGVDIGYRLWDVAKRRQPPKPKPPKPPAVKPPPVPFNLG